FVETRASNQLNVMRISRAGITIDPPFSASGAMVIKALSSAVISKDLIPVTVGIPSTTADVAFTIAGGGFRKHLDRDVTAQSRIPRSIYLPHTAGAKSGEDFIRAQTTTRSQSHWCENARL